MTVEHLWVASLLDIKAVALVCNECESRYTMPMSRDIELPLICPRCSHKWLVIYERHEMEGYLERDGERMRSVLYPPLSGEPSEVSAKERVS